MDFNDGRFRNVDDTKVIQTSFLQHKRILNLKFRFKYPTFTELFQELIQNDGWIGNVNNTSDLANQ
jgi:hypothetical protein